MFSSMGGARETFQSPAGRSSGQKNGQENFLKFFVTDRLWPDYVQVKALLVTDERLEKLDEVEARLKDPRDRALVGLLRQGEKRVAEYARALGIETLVPAEQALHVNRAKHRIRTMLGRKLAGKR